jgi:hypothetical protein
MNRMIACAVALAFLATAGSPAWAKDAKGKIKTWETTTRVVTLEDGTQYVITDKVKKTEKIKAGQQVKMVYDERDGKNMVTELEEVEAP